MLKSVKKIFGAGKSKQMDHPYFGHLHFFKPKGSQHPYWQGEIRPVSQTFAITIRIHADEQGPTREQDKFLRRIVSDPDSLVPLFSDLVKPHFERWCQKTYADHFLKEFECTGLLIPMDGDQKKDWAITFTRISDGDFVFSVFFENGVAINTDLDG